MSRFFRGGASDSESDSFTESETESEFSVDEQEVQQQQQQSQQQPQKTSAFSKFLRNEADSDDDSDDGRKRVVKSAKDKFDDEVKAIVGSIDASMDEDEYARVVSEFDRLMKLINKHLNNIIRDHGYPRLFLQCLLDLDAYAKDILGQDSKQSSLNSADQKSVVAIKTKVRKVMQPLEDEIASYKASGASSRQMDSSESEEETSADELAPKKKQSGGNAFFKSVSETESEDEEEETEEEESDEDESVQKDSQKQDGGIASRWKKTTSTTPSAFAKTPSAAPAKKTKQVTKPSAAAQKPEEGGDQKQQQQQPEKKVEELTPENLYERLRILLESRGKKGTDKVAQMKQLELMLAMADNPVKKVKVLLSLISARLDFNVVTNVNMSVENVLRIKQEVSQLLDALEQNQHLSLSENGEEWFEAKDEDETTQNRRVIKGNLVSIISRLDNEFEKNLQAGASTLTEYIKRLSEEASMYQMICRTEAYCHSRQDKDDVVLLQILKLDHLYYKKNDLIVKLDQKVRDTAAADNYIHQICSSVISHSQDKIRVKVLLQHAYYLALHGKYQQARNLLLSFQLGDTISTQELSTQVLFNRVMAQIGIAAFRLGHFQESYNALNDIMGSLKTKDLLAQGTQLSKYLALEQDNKREKVGVLPFHQHIDLELLEVIQLSVTLLLEIPQMSAQSYELRKRFYSRHFKRLYDQYASSLTRGPAESFRDSVFEAARLLADGDWRGCSDLLCGLKVWNTLGDRDQVKSHLTKNIKTQALKTYLLKAGDFYDTLSVSDLQTKFDMSESQVKSTALKMLYNQEFLGSMDMQKRCIRFNGGKLSKVYYLAMHYSERMFNLVDANEKLYTYKLEPQKLVDEARNAIRKAKRQDN
ncbi:hypothetical protein MP228_005142 [Amoeboaphelidium protococcarum]|nr:hypothetical protein MP228_005142 [Amoeboaphelidium protococcarum]